MGAFRRRAGSRLFDSSLMAQFYIDLGLLNMAANSLDACEFSFDASRRSNYSTNRLVLGGGMRSYQIKRARPTLKTAHEFYKEGGFLTDPKIHLLSGKEREAEIKNVADELCEIVTHQFPRTQNLEYAILKSHLIVEFALVQYIRCFAAVATSTKDIRFTFSQKLEFAYLLGFGANDPLLLPTVEQLNRVRNQVAHTFTLDRTVVDELLRINHEDYDEFTPRDDRERIKLLRRICIFVCALVAGKIEAAYFISTIPRSDQRESKPSTD